MTIGFQTIRDIKMIESDAADLGFRFGYSKCGGDASSTIGLYPLDDAFPTYGRDAELFAGDLSQVRAFLRGVEVAIIYLKTLGVVTDAKIEKKEQNLKNKKLNDILKNSGKEENK